ncbi:MAG: DNA-binding protein [Halioglobus sp.]|nr:DNA-binding protein [Halioglobus sp.]|tara:strand:+ start:1734 stop:2174 length:441 start_codon:yes stop_codon:yes gene_type:complete
MATGNAVLAGLAKSKVKARAALKGMSSSEIEKLISNLSAVLETEIKKEQARAEAAKNAKIAKIRALMEESGLDAADLQDTAKRRGRKKTAVKSKAKAAAKKRKVAPKYRLVVDGKEHLWSGRGRAPTVFKEYLDAGNSKESCAIRK